MQRWGVLLVFLFTVIGFQAKADLAFNNINADDLAVINKDFSSTFAYSSVSGPSSLGNIFGIEAGIIAGGAMTEGIEALAKEVDASSEVSFLPHAWLVGALTVPFGITAEVNIIPELDGGDVKFEHLGLGVKWTISDMIPIPAVAVSVKGFFSQSKVKFSQTVGAVNSDISYENSMYGLLAQVGMNLLIVEPYVGLGWVSSEGDLSSTASAVFDPSLTTGTSATSEEDGTFVQAGVNLKLLLIRLGFEYQRTFDADRFSAKLSLKF